MKTGLNHLSTDDKTAEAVIPVVDAGTGTASVTSSQQGTNFQDFLEWKRYSNELGLGFLNVHAGVNRVQVGVNLLNPTQKS